MRPFGNPPRTTTRRAQFVTFLTNGTRFEIVAHVELSGTAAKATRQFAFPVAPRAFIAATRTGIFHDAFLLRVFLECPVHFQS